MRRIISILTLFLAAACLLLNGCQKEKELSAQDWIDRGLAFEESQRFDDAINAYTKAMEADPNSADAYLNRGIALARTGNFDRAIEDYTKALEINPRFVQAFEDFTALCHQTINPNISPQAVEEMLIQHLLTERIFRKVFDNPDLPTATLSPARSKRSSWR